jgi:hypothetical protein
LRLLSRRAPKEPRAGTNVWNSGSMTIEIRRLDQNDGQQLRSIVDLQRKAFPHVPEIEEQTLHNATRARSIFYGAFDGNLLIGANGFIEHGLFCKGGRQIGFQSCSSATDPNYRGRGVFSRIINHAKTDLANAGSFIFGFPNENSTRIFLGPLNFEGFGMRKFLFTQLSMPSILREFARATRRDPKIDQFDQRAVFEWQKSRPNRDLVSFSSGGSFLWGQVGNQRLLGASRIVFQIGGLDVSDAHEVGPLLAALREKVKPSAFTATSTKMSAFARSTTARAFWRSSGTFIVFPLRQSVLPQNILAFGGLADYF